MMSGGTSANNWSASGTEIDRATKFCPGSPVDGRRVRTSHEIIEGRMMTSLQGKTPLDHRGQPRHRPGDALRAARDGANIAVVAKTDQPHPSCRGRSIPPWRRSRLPADADWLGITDIRSEEQVQGGHRSDGRPSSAASIYSRQQRASAIQLTGTTATEMKRFDLMHSVNVRGTFLCSKLCIPHLRKAANPHILNLSPPLNMEAKWFQHHVAYTMSKFGMSMCVLGMSMELRPQGIAVNALWPRTAIATAAVQNLLGGEAIVARCRKPEIMADAAHLVLTKESRSCSGNFFIDDAVLAAAGVTDLDRYAVTSGARN
ncbi:MAG: SDR family oxidoreductase [Planctomycetaceae bacterium]